MDRKSVNNLLVRTMWSMYDTVESTVQFCRQKPYVHNSTLLKNTYEVALTQGPLLLVLYECKSIMWLFPWFWEDKRHLDNSLSLPPFEILLGLLHPLLQLPPEVLLKPGIFNIINLRKGVKKSFLFRTYPQRGGVPLSANVGEKLCVF